MLKKRLEIAHLPTPLELADRLKKPLPGPTIYIKRDDTTGLAGGGNKARKLEYLAADALAQGANCLATVGGPQSNHARMTAALAARLGLKCRLYLKGERPQGLRGNLLLDRLLGAELIFCGQVEYSEIYKRIDADAKELKGQGIEIYKVPVGGSTAVGALGYVQAILSELVPQCQDIGIHPDAMVVAVGSGGTMAGIMLGLALAEWEIPVYGYSVSGDAAGLCREVAHIYNDAAGLLQRETRIQTDQVLIDDSHIGPGYGIATPGGLEALKIFARHQGILLDSVYTAKAAAGMIADIHLGRWQKETIIFWHTGGWPALFAKDDVEAWLLGEEIN